MSRPKLRPSDENLSPRVTLSADAEYYTIRYSHTVTLLNADVEMEMDIICF